MDHPVVNEHEYRILALKRSGHHAIVQWILANVEGTYCFLNNCRPHASPFDAEFIEARPDKRLLTNIEGFDLLREIAGEHSHKDFLLYNYEHRSLDTVIETANALDHDAVLGRSAEAASLIILRDPYNNLASGLRRAYERHGRPRRRLNDRCQAWRARIGGQGGRDPFERELARRGDPRLAVYQDLRRTADLWKEYAEEAIGVTSRLGGATWISFNRWFAESEYRDQLARDLGLATSDRAVEEVAGWGAGSSFDAASYGGRAGRMMVLERWREFAEDEIYQAVIADERLRELSVQLFGEIDGTGRSSADGPASALG